MSPEQQRAVDELGRTLGWDRMTTRDLGLMLWALFRYYATRL